MELLRMLCMFVLPFLHFCVFSLPQSVSYAEHTGFWAQFPKILCSFMTLQVNIFVLISGWFGIRTTIKKIINFYLVCAFYGIMTYGLSFLFPDTVFSAKSLLISFLPFSFFPGWWFVKAYLFLMLLAPLFNAAIEHMSKREYMWVLLALTFINVYCGFFARQAINSDGCNFMQVVYMYFVGRYLALHVSIENNKLRKWTAYASVIGVLSYAGTWIANDTCLHLVKSLTFFNNNNPWSLFNSIVIFLFFTTLSFQSRSINWLAKGVFPVYLIHTSIWLSKYWNGSLTSIYDAHSPSIAWLIITVVCAVYFFSVLCFDHIRILLTEPISKKVENYANRYHLYI